MGKDKMHMVTQQKYDKLKAMLIALRKKNKLMREDANKFTHALALSAIKTAIKGTGVTITDEGGNYDAIIVKNKYGVTGDIRFWIGFLKVGSSVKVRYFSLMLQNSKKYFNYEKTNNVDRFNEYLLPAVMKAFGMVREDSPDKPKTSNRNVSYKSIHRVISELVKQINETIKDEGNGILLSPQLKNKLMLAYKKDLSLGDLPLDTWPDELEDTISMFVTLYGMGSEPNTSYFSLLTTDLLQTTLENLWTIVLDLLKGHDVDSITW